VQSWLAERPGPARGDVLCIWGLAALSTPAFMQLDMCVKVADAAFMDAHDIQFEAQRTRGTEAPLDPVLTATLAGYCELIEPILRSKDKEEACAHAGAAYQRMCGVQAETR